jgi:hypothetical protein
MDLVIRYRCRWREQLRPRIPQAGEHPVDVVGFGGVLYQDPHLVGLVQLLGEVAHWRPAGNV